jgi:hypothetical protein
MCCMTSLPVLLATYHRMLERYMNDELGSICGLVQFRHSPEAEENYENPQSVLRPRLEWERLERSAVRV